MLNLENLAPTDHERTLVNGMPEQVAIGYLRARRKHLHGRRDNGPTGTPRDGLLDLTDLFGGIFKGTGE
jgi:hypothetical protein